MPDRDDAPDPMDEAFLRAEQALDDEAARSARRARVLAAVAQEPATPPAAAPSARRRIRRYGGWLAAACVAGISLVTAEQVYRLSPRREQATPPPVQPPASPAAKAPAPPAAAVPPPSRAPQTSSAPPPVAARAAPRPIIPISPVAPPPDIAPPPPLPIPPVEKPVQAPPAPAPPPPPAIAEPKLSGRVAEDVVVNARRASPSVTASSAALAAKASDGAPRLRDAASAGRTAEIETLLAQGVPVDAADENGETALMKSVEAGQRDAAALLRRHGADLDHKSRAGVSARDMALQKDDPRLDQALGLER